MLNRVRTPRLFRISATFPITGWKWGAKRRTSPAESRHAAARSGEEGRAAPRASATSALPHLLETDRLPCFAMGIPPPAATKAAAVEMLKDPAQSPPVPQLSTRSPGRTGTVLAFRRSTRAAPPISAGVSPRARRAARKAATWTGGTVPSMTISMASSISAFPRRCFSITRERYGANMTLPPLDKKKRGRETCPAPLPRMGYKKGRERRSLVGPASTAVKCALFIGSRALWSPAAGYLARHHQFWLSVFRIMTTASRKRIGEKIPRPARSVNR